MSKNTVILDLKEYENLKYDYENTKKELKDVLNNKTTVLHRPIINVSSCEISYYRGQPVINLFCSNSDSNDRLMEIEKNLRISYNEIKNKLEDYEITKQINESQKVKINELKKIVNFYKNRKWYYFGF